MVNANPPDCQEILQELYRTNAKIHSLQMDLLLNERVHGEMVPGKNFIQISSTPTKIYIKQEFPNEGLEILYNETIDKEKAFVYTNSFPWITIKLDPLGDLMRKETHHSIFKSDFNFVISLLKKATDNYAAKLDEICSYQGLVKYDDQLCYKLELTLNNFKFIDYKVEEGETLEDLSYKLNVNDFMIWEQNPQINSVDDIAAGDIIKVPTLYAKAITLYIIKDSYLLKGVKVYDDKGLYEDYVYRNVIVNPDFEPDQFTTDYPKYNF